MTTSRFPWKGSVWKGDEVRTEGGMTIEGAKEQEDRTCSQIMKLDRGGSTSKGEELDG